MPEKISKQDEDLIEAEAKDGEIIKGDQEIDEVSIEFDRDDFPSLDKDKVGDEVVVVLAGYVTKTEDDAVMVEFNRASVVHGKMTPEQKKKVMSMEDELSGKKGADNKYALARYIALRRKK